MQYIHNTQICAHGHLYRASVELIHSNLTEKYASENKLKTFCKQFLAEIMFRI